MFVACTTIGANAEMLVAAPLTLDAALAEANSQNPEILAASSAVDVARGALTQTALPPLSGQLAPSITQDVPRGLGSVQTLSAGVSQQFSPALSAERRAASSGVDIANAEYAGVRRRIDVRVVSAYYALASAQAVVLANQQSAESAKQFERSAALRSRVGAAGSFEVLRARVERRRAQTEVLRAQAVETNAQIALDVLLARSTVSRSSVLLPSTTSAPVGIEALYARAAAIDPELAQYRASIVQAIAQRRAAELQRRPSIGLSGGYLVQRAPSLSGVVSHGPTAALTVSLPLFDHGTIRGAVEQARARQIVAERQLDGRNAQLRGDLEQNVSDIESAQALVTFARQSLIQAQEALRLAQFGYRQGALGVLDILSARAQVTAAQSEVTQASADFGAAVARLQLIVGESGTP